MVSDAQEREYARLRGELHAEYERLLATRTRFQSDPAVKRIFGAGSTPEAPWLQRFREYIDESVKVSTDAYERLAPIEWDFAAIAMHDARLWRMAAREATAARNKIQRMSKDVLFDTGKTETQIDLDADPPRPGPPHVTRASHPWKGRAGEAYTHSLSEQIQAEAAMAEVCEAAAAFLETLSRAFAGMVQALRDLIRQEQYFLALTIVGAISLASSIYTRAAGFVGALVAFGWACVQRLYLVSGAIEAYEKARLDFANFANTELEKISRKIGDQVADVFKDGAAHNWPDHASQPWFPHVFRDRRTGTYRMSTGLMHGSTDGTDPERLMPGTLPAPPEDR